MAETTGFGYDQGTHTPCTDKHVHGAKDRRLGPSIKE